MTTTYSIVLLSGGVDSTALLWRELRSFGPNGVLALSVHYGQRHQKEIAAASAVAAKAGVAHQIVSLGGAADVLFAGSALTSAIDVPDGHYTDESMAITVVPNRNMVLLSLATAYAVSRGSPRVAYAAHAGDHAIYPDCRPEFVGFMNDAIMAATDDGVALWAPYQDMTKAEIVKEGHRAGAPLGLTWSCYKGGEKHCGKCGTCVERREAFVKAGVNDPTGWAD